MAEARQSWVSITGVQHVDIYGTTSQHWTVTNITKAIVFSQSDLNTRYHQGTVSKLCFMPLDRLGTRTPPH